MPQIDVQPIVLKNVLLSIGLDTYEKHVSSVTFTPTTSSTEWRGLNPDAVFTDPGSTTWACTLEYVQDWTTQSSLSRYLFDHEGETVTVQFKPDAANMVDMPTFEADLVIIPGAIGGAVNAYSTGSVTLGVQGRPTIVDPV